MLESNVKLKQNCLPAFSEVQNHHLKSFKQPLKLHEVSTPQGKYNNESCKPLCVFKYLGDTTKRCPHALPKVVLQKGKAEVPLGCTHRLHSRAVTLPHRILQQLIQFSDLLQPRLQDRKQPIKISAVVLTVHIYHFASKLSVSWIFDAMLIAQWLCAWMETLRRDWLKASRGSEVASGRRWTLHQLGIHLSKQTLPVQ